MASHVLVWRSLDAPRMEIAHVECAGSSLRARGTQIGADYELRYRLDGSRLEAEIVDGDAVTIELSDADFFDLGFSPLFNTLPVLRDDLLRESKPHDYVMRWVAVPELTVELSDQRYEPLGNRRVRFVAGTFEADLELDEDGFVLRYPGLAERVG